MHALVNIALRAALDAAEAAAHSSDRLDRVRIIDDNPDSFLTSMDQDADKTVLYHIEKAYPTHSILSRVSGLKQGQDRDSVWLVDPLLGNRNFAAGFPNFGVSVAFQSAGVVNHAAVVCPLTREEFTASRGKGAQLNSRRLRVDSNPDLKGALLGLNEQGLNSDKFLSFQKAMLEGNASPRMSGSTPLDILLTATARLRGGWGANAGQSSMAAVNLILLEAGGLIGSEAGNPDIGSGKELLFANPKLFRQLVKIRSNC